PAANALALFPSPSRPLSELRTIPSPRYLGRTPASTAALREILTDNHERWHIFFNKLRYHNHTPATILSQWALGANETLLRASYYENSYMDFFEGEMKRLGTHQMLEEYIFSKDVNFPDDGGVQPEMLSRCFDSIMHPMINIGNGLEFNVPGMVVEGLAQVAIHRPTSTLLIPADWWRADREPSSEDINLDPSAINQKNRKGRGLSPLTLLARILKDPEMGNFRRPPSMKLYESIMNSHGDRIKAYLDQWDLSGDLDKMVEELIWLWTLVYAVCGYTPGEKFLAELFMGHAVYSSLYLAPWVAHISESSAKKFLRGYFGVTLAYYIGRGRAPLNLKAFFNDPSLLHPLIPGPQPVPSHEALSANKPEYCITPNPWLSILQEALVHPDEHVATLQRSLKHFAELFEHVERGHFSDTELEGGEYIDGTLFIRAAVLSANRFGWLREGQPLKDSAQGESMPMTDFVWDAKGYFQ
ncbi:hypothetical protein BKA70DRAFT_1505982, partial [Coprinopsis sp. MPI-PUGE-AT-0042]